MKSKYQGPSNFAFATATLALIEKKLIPQSDFEKLRVADSMKEFERMLSDTVYGSYLEKGEDIKVMMEKELIRTKDDLYEILPQEVHSLFDIFFRKYDYNNLKMLLKSYFMGASYPEEDLSGVGTIPPEDLLSFFVEEKFEEFPFDIDIEALRDKFKHTGELRGVDGALDQAYYFEYAAAMEDMGDPFFLDFARQQIDLKNILIFIRCTRTGLPVEDFILDGGNISPYDFSKAEGKGIEILLTEGEFANYKQIIASGLASVEKTWSYSELETAIRNYFISILTEIRDNFFNVRPFIGYLLAKEHEINLIKKIYIYVSNQMDFGAERDLVYV